MGLISFSKLSTMAGKDLLKRLGAGEVILGDGSYTITLEKRGYVLCNAWTPEAAVEHPDAVRNLALEFARAGGDITQTYTFFSDDKRLKEKGTITAGGIAMTDIYQST